MLFHVFTTHFFTQDTFSLIVCNLPVVVTFALRQLGKPEEETDHATGSTFGWRVASRKTGATATTNSDTAVTTVNLRDFTTNAVVTNPTLTQIEREAARSEFARTVDMSEMGLGGRTNDGAPRQQKSIVWFVPEKVSKGDVTEDDDEGK